MYSISFLMISFVFIFSNAKTFPTQYSRLFRLISNFLIPDFMSLKYLSCINNSCTIKTIVFDFVQRASKHQH